MLPPLAQAGLEDEVVWLHHFSWHVGSVAIVLMVGMYFYASVRPGNLALAVAATLMSIGFALLGIGMAVFGSDVLWGTPAPYVWSLIALLGLLGLWKSPENQRT